MAKITQAGEGRSSTDARIDSRGPTFNLRGAQSIGQQEKQLGREIENLGEAYFKTAQKSLRDSSYNDAISTATLELNKRYQERLSQAFDKNGNPTFANIDKDIQQISKDIQEELAVKLTDPEVKAKFDLSFNNMVTNKRLQGQGQARRQHMAYAQSSLNKALNSYVEAAGQDEDSNINMYAGQVNQAIEDAVQNGVLAPDVAETLKQEYIDSIRVAANQKFIDENPEAAEKYIAQGAEAIGVSKKKQQELDRIAKAAVRDEKRLIKKQSADIRKKVKAQQEATMADLEIGILKGTVGEEDIETAVNSNMDINGLVANLHPQVGQELANENPTNITQKQRVRLIKQIQKQIVEEEAKAVKAQEIDAARESGIKLSSTFKPKDIKERYDADIEQISKTDENGVKVPPTLLEKAGVAITYNAPLEDFTNDIKFGIRNSTGDQAEDVLRAYNVVKNKQPAAIDKLPKKDRAIVSMANMLVNHTNISPNDAFEIARERHAASEKSDIRIEREDEFKKVDAFKPAKVEATIKDLYNLDSFIGFGGKALQPGVKARFQNLLREAYVLTGDEDAAKEMLKDMTAHTYGVSEFNEIPGVLDDTERFMFMPPEKAYPGVPPEALKNNLKEGIKAFLPEGVNPDQVGINSDELTRSTGDKVTYGLFYIDDKGREITVTDQNGIPLRWEPDYMDLIKKQTEEAITEAKEKRIQEKKVQDILKRRFTD